MSLVSVREHPQIRIEKQDHSKLNALNIAIVLNENI